MESNAVSDDEMMGVEFGVLVMDGKLADSEWVDLRISHLVLLMTEVGGYGIGFNPPSPSIL